MVKGRRGRLAGMLGASAALVALCLTWPSSPVAATSATFTSTRANDTSIDSRVRIQQVGASYSSTSGLVTLSLSVAQGTDPMTDPGWANGPTGPGWAIDINGHTSADFVAVAYRDSNGNFVGAVGQPDTSITCGGSAVAVAYKADLNQYTIAFDRNCIAAPSSLGLRAIMDYVPSGSSTDVYDVEPTGNEPDCCQVTPSADPTTTTTPSPTSSTSSTTSTTQLPAKSVTRIAGSGRLQTAIAVSQSSYPSKASAKAAVLANDASFADALAGTPLAVAKVAPLLLTGHDNLDPSVAGELQRALAPGATVYLLGGTFVLSDNVATQVQNLGFSVTRYAGADRFETATVIAQNLPSRNAFLVANGVDFPDALAAGAAAAAKGGAVLLTNGPGFTPGTATYINAHRDVVRYAIGGAAAAADPTSTTVKLVGADRYETSTLVATTFFNSPPKVGVASGQTFPDALSGGVHIAQNGGPMILVPRSGALPSSIGKYLTSVKGSVAGGFAYGGTFVLGDDVVTAVQQAIS